MELKFRSAAFRPQPSATVRPDAAIPAQAGIHAPALESAWDFRLRGNDGLRNSPGAGKCLLKNKN